MAEWYEQTYKLGTPINMPGFPRPLYPPDAAPGKQPSSNGPDVEAFKRIAWRLGRWPGPASGFDRAYSNNFSHGKGPNVIDSGMAGVQRQAGIDPDSGWVGKQTWDLVRRVKIPSGIPNGPGQAGDYAMDAYTQSLFVQAWGIFGGEEPKPEPPPEKALRQKALEMAITQIGVTESPPFSNQTKYTQWYGMTGPWCAMFCTWSFENAGDSPSFVKGRNYAYVPYVVGDARENRNGLFVTKDPIPGDLVCFDWGYDGVHDHIGIFERWISRQDGSFFCIEGNTAPTNDSDGGEVMRRERTLSSARVTFVRVKEPA